MGNLELKATNHLLTMSVCVPACVDHHKVALVKRQCRLDVRRKYFFHLG